MGQVGRWIDTLGERERDAIIMHPDPTYDGVRWWDEDRDCGCLVGCAIGKLEAEDLTGISFASPPVPRSIRNTPAAAVGFMFFEACERFTAERMWRVVKARAAKGHASLTTAAVPAPQHTAGAAAV